jgi:hypothetical protein
MHRDDFKALLYFNAEAARELPDYEAFDELRTLIQDNDDYSICDQDDLEEFFHHGMADTMADGVISSFASDDKEKLVLGWSVKETIEGIRLRHLPRYDAFNQRTSLKDVEDFIHAVNNDLYESAVHIAQFVMYLPEQIIHMEKFPVRKIPKFDWKPR